MARTPTTYLGEVDVEEEGLLGVGDLDAVLLVPLRAAPGRRGPSPGDAKVVHGLDDLIHCRRHRCEKT